MSAPQVTPADVEAVIASEHYFTGAQGCIGNVDAVDLSDAALASLDMLTICALVTRNGHTVTGEAYCADPAKFNAETGRIEARKVAINKLWPMVVYAERERLAAGASAVAPALDFGDAIRALKAGKRVARDGWNGKGMWGEYVPAKDFSFSELNPHFVIKNTNNSFSTWVPSINDCLADDWQIVS